VEAYRASVDAAGKALSSGPTSYAQRRMVKQINAARYKMFKAMGSDQYKLPIKADGRWFWEGPALAEPTTIKNVLKYPEEYGKTWDKYKRILGMPIDKSNKDLASEVGRQISAAIDNPEVYTEGAQRYNLPQLLLPLARFFGTRQGSRIAEAVKDIEGAQYTQGPVSHIKDIIMKEPKKHGGRLAELLQLRGNKVGGHGDIDGIVHLLGAKDDVYDTIKKRLTISRGVSFEDADTYLQTFEDAKNPELVKKMISDNVHPRYIYEYGQVLNQSPRPQVALSLLTQGVPPYDIPEHIRAISNKEEITQLLGPLAKKIPEDKISLYLIPLRHTDSPERVREMISKGMAPEQIMKYEDRLKWQKRVKEMIGQKISSGVNLAKEEDIWLPGLKDVREYRRGTYLISGSPQWGNVCTSRNYCPDVEKGMRRLIGVGTGKDRRLLHYMGRVDRDHWSLDHFIGPNNDPISSDIEKLPESVRKQLPGIEKYLNKNARLGIK
jgi:hypothetical protein